MFRGEPANLSHFSSTRNKFIFNALVSPLKSRHERRAAHPRRSSPPPIPYHSPLELLEVLELVLKGLGLSSKVGGGSVGVGCLLPSGALKYVFLELKKIWTKLRSRKTISFDCACFQLDPSNSAPTVRVRVSDPPKSANGYDLYKLVFM